MSSDLPQDPAALRSLANACVAQGKNADALALLWQALALRPDDAQTLNDLGNALTNERRAEEGLALLLHALEFRPEEAKLHSNVGLALANLGRLEEAMAAQRTALRLEPRLGAAHTNMGNLLMMLGRPREALGHFETALEMEPQSQKAIRNRAIALLASGDLAEGFRGYEMRWSLEQGDAFGAKLARPPARWEGQSLAGKRILVVAEQGIGDVIHFVRYAALLKARGAYVLLECPALLMEILRGVPGVDEFLVQGEFGGDRGAYPPFDFHAPLMSLPHHCGTTLETIPAEVPYLVVGEERRARWKERLALGTDRLNVGIVWQGNPNHQWDRFRSVPLTRFEGVARVPGVRLVSLQRGPGIEQMGGFQVATGGALGVPTEGRQEVAGDLADSAAIISLLDLVISVDSAPAHLAAALGLPTWIMLSVAADWRWLTGREDSPWYPSVSLFRQKVIQEWEPVFGEVEQRLRQRASGAMTLTPKADAGG